MENKIKTREDLADIIKQERKACKKVGFTNGCFDVLHLGHIKYLQEAKDACDLLIVGVNSDDSVRRLNKGDERPINPQDARAGVLSGLESVDYITIFDEDTPLELIRALTPGIIFKGGDWAEKDVVGADHVVSLGGEVKIIQFVDGYSTTEIINKIKGK